MGKEMPSQNQQISEPCLFKKVCSMCVPFSQSKANQQNSILAAFETCFAQSALPGGTNGKVESLHHV